MLTKILGPESTSNDNGHFVFRSEMISTPVNQGVQVKEINICNVFINLNLY